MTKSGHTCNDCCEDTVMVAHTWNADVINNTVDIDLYLDTDDIYYKISVVVEDVDLF